MLGDDSQENIMLPEPFRDSHENWREKLRQIKMSKQVPDAAMLLSPLKQSLREKFFTKFSHLKKFQQANTPQNSVIPPITITAPIEKKTEVVQKKSSMAIKIGILEGVSQDSTQKLETKSKRSQFATNDQSLVGASQSVSESNHRTEDESQPKKVQQFSLKLNKRSAFQ